MTTVSLSYTSKEKINIDDILITVNDQTYPCELHDDKIIVHGPDNFSFHMLKLKYQTITEEQTVEITDVHINTSSVRHTLYLSYSPVSNTRFNTTHITSEHSEWHLPYGNPVSWWLTECARNFKSSTYGKQVDQEYKVWYPESTTLNGDFPQTVKDFFQYNFGFTAVEKEEFKNPCHNLKIPFLRLPNLEYDEEKLFQEVSQRSDEFNKSDWQPLQNKYVDYDFNIKDSSAIPWQIFARTTDRLSDIESLFPECAKIQKQLLDSDCYIGLTFLGCLHDQSFVVPHVDDYTVFIPTVTPEQVGLTKIWIPIGWEENNVFKFDKVGNIPINQGAWLINPNKFAHASFNQSGKPRYTLAFNIGIRNPDKFARFL